MVLVLLDEGIISEEEFEAKKRQLIGILFSWLLFRNITTVCLLLDVNI